MNISKDTNKIIINNPTHFDIMQILKSGQVFRYSQLQDNSYQLISSDKKCLLRKYQDRIEIITEHFDYFYDYFDLSTDYTKIIDTLNSQYGISSVTEYGRGIRILKQDIFETIISFIISANNNIPRIKGIIDRLCNALGKDCDNYKAFPTAEQIALANYDIIDNIGAGYRARYIYDTANMIYQGYELDSIKTMDTSKARKYLTALSGVGPKVADCILLFAYHKMDVFPVDTWIAKVYLDECGVCDSNKKMSNYLTHKYKNLSGYAQQYLFYYKRKSHN